MLGLAAGIMAEVKIFAKLSTGGAVLLDEVLAQGSLAPPDNDKKTNKSNWERYAKKETSHFFHTC